jgi:hypothetical protein
MIDAVINRHQALISFESLGNERHYVYLLFALTQVGAVGCSARAAQYAWAWLPLKDFIRNIQINWRTPSDGILISERAGVNGIIQINRQYYSSPVADHRLFVPYFAHPVFYKSGLYNAVRVMRGGERNIRIFFAGTIPETSEEREQAAARYGLLSRSKILNHVIARFEWAISTELAENDSHPILIVATSDTRDVINKYALDLKRYVETMSRSDFFICLPGKIMPHSHNLIEAMSVGTIPITNYHSYMRPPLTPEENCLAFSTLEELETVIDYALRMPSIEVKRLREAVISYYDKYIEPEQFGKTLIKCLPAISELVVNDESGR